MLVKIYDIEFKNSWPYDKEVGVRVADDSDPIILDASGNDRMWRMPRAAGHIGWALV